MTPDDDQSLLCTRCGYDLRLLTANRCPECGTPFRSREELRALRHEEVAILDVAERATAKAVVGLAASVVIGVLVLLGIRIVVNVSMGQPNSEQVAGGFQTAVALTLVYYAAATLWIGRRLLRTLRREDYRGVIGAAIVFLIWSVVGALAQFFMILMIYSFD